MMELDAFYGFVFIDEVKHTVANNEGEDSFYYFGIVVPKNILSRVQQEYDNLVSHLPTGFHAKKSYKSKAIDIVLLRSLTDILIKFKLRLVVFRYDKQRLYKATKEFLVKLNHPEVTGRETNWEMQAFFHFIQHLSTFVSNNKQIIDVPLCAFCDRGIYGNDDPIEALEISSPDLKRAVFTSRKKVKLLGLADHVGFLFAKARLAVNQVSDKDHSLALQQNIFGQHLDRIARARLFHYLEA